MVNPEKRLWLEIRPRLFRTVWILLSEYSPNHSTKLARDEELPGVRSPEMACLSDSRERSMSDLMVRSYRAEHFLMRGPWGFDSVPPCARLSWTCGETARFRESLTLAMPSTVASKSLGVLFAPT